MVTMPILVKERGFTYVDLSVWVWSLLCSSGNNGCGFSAGCSSVQHYIPAMDYVSELPRALVGKKNVIFGNIPALLKFNKRLALLYGKTYIHDHNTDKHAVVCMCVCVFLVQEEVQ